MFQICSVVCFCSSDVVLWCSWHIGSLIRGVAECKKKWRGQYQEEDFVSSIGGKKLLFREANGSPWFLFLIFFKEPKIVGKSPLGPPDPPGFRRTWAFILSINPFFQIEGKHGLHPQHSSALRWCFAEIQNSSVPPLPLPLVQAWIPAKLAPLASLFRPDSFPWHQRIPKWLKGPHKSFLFWGASSWWSKDDIGVMADWRNELQFGRDMMLLSKG